MLAVGLAANRLSSSDEIVLVSLDEWPYELW